MSRKGLGILAVLAVIVIGVIVFTSGSSDHSSEWTSAQEDQLKTELAEKAPEFTSRGIDCIVKGVKPAFSPTQEGFSDSDKAKVQDVAKKCAEESSENVQGILSQACQDEGILSTTCLDEVTSPAIEREEESLNEYEEEQGIESYSEEGYGESYGEDEYESEYETENEGLNEMDQGLREEYEREEEETGEPHPYPSE